MRSGGLAATQWIARVAYNLPTVAGGFTAYYAEVHRILLTLERHGHVESRREQQDPARGRREWRISRA